MSALFWNTVTEDMRQILHEFFRSKSGGKFYLAGGTALSLQLGHRNSVDLDLFSPTEDIPSIRSSLEESLSNLKPELADSSWGNAVLSRANRKDFYDLYFIAQTVPLKGLFEVAPQKYPSVRDFEVQVVKRLVYFDTADYDPDPILLKSLSWNSVKDYFTQQAKEIEQGWLK